jgi:hypothetical protein
MAWCCAGNDGSIHALRDYSAVRFPELPGGLITRPTLEWQVAAPRGGEQRTRVTYQTAGITWWADYNLIFNEGKDANSGLLDLSAWVSIINQSGDYPDARLKLIAGDVHRASRRAGPRRSARWRWRARSMEERRGRLRGEGVLRVPPLHARPAHHAAEQLDQADRAVRPGEADPGAQALVYYGLAQPTAGARR